MYLFEVLEFNRLLNLYNYLFVKQSTWLPLPRLYQLNLAGGEANEERCTVGHCRCLIEIMAARIGAFVQFLVNRFTKFRRELDKLKKE